MLYIKKCSETKLLCCSALCNNQRKDSWTNGLTNADSALMHMGWKSRERVLKILEECSCFLKKKSQVGYILLYSIALLSTHFLRIMLGGPMTYPPTPPCVFREKNSLQSCAIFDFLKLLKTIITRIAKTSFFAFTFWRSTTKSKNSNLHFFSHFCFNCTFCFLISILFLQYLSSKNPLNCWKTIVVPKVRMVTFLPLSLV